MNINDTLFILCRAHTALGELRGIGTDTDIDRQLAPIEDALGELRGCIENEITMTADCLNATILGTIHRQERRESQEERLIKAIFQPEPPAPNPDGVCPTTNKPREYCTGAEAKTEQETKTWPDTEPEPEQLKQCTKCGQPKPLGEFRVYRGNSRRCWCRSCENEYQKAHDAKKKAERDAAGPEAPAQKCCTKCKKNKLVDEFGRHGNGRSRSWCKSCEAEYQREREQRKKNAKARQTGHYETTPALHQAAEEITQDLSPEQLETVQQAAEDVREALVLEPADAVCTPAFLDVYTRSLWFMDVINPSANPLEFTLWKRDGHDRTISCLASLLDDQTYPTLDAAREALETFAKTQPNWSRRKGPEIGTAYAARQEANP